MASQISGGHDRPSFAEVAAMPPVPKSHDATKSQDAPLAESADLLSTSVTTLSEEHNFTISAENEKSQDPSADGLNESVQALNLSEEKKGRMGDMESVEVANENPLKTDGVFDDARTHLSTSSTKPTSFDSKSMASVTTFAMDEKESLRPDDSASVQAIEEDENFSGSVSGAQNSQVSSEAGDRSHQVSDALKPLQGVLGNGPASGSLPGMPGMRASNPQGERQLHGFPNEPDEKLLEAMNSPKDRLFVLQLEDKIIRFVKNTSEQSLELPPSNAFGRLLAHKLGDYYHLTHFVDNNATSVRLHRTPWSRLPTPLSMLQPNTNQTPPPNAPAMKIMRRVGQPAEKTSASGSTAPSSSAPSKTASEAGAEVEDAASSSAATPAKDRVTMSREEREAKYQEARERIFRDFPESKSFESPKNGEQSTNVSRSSSKAGRKKGHRQKTPHDDGFEARSQFNAYYYGPPFAAGQLSYNGMMNDGSVVAPTYSLGPGPGVNFAPTAMNTMYTPHANMSSIAPYSMNSPALAHQNNAWQGGNMQHGYPPPSQVPPIMAQQTPPRQGANMNAYPQYPLQTSQNWGQPQYQGNFHVPGGQRSVAPQNWSGVPSHTGQVPYSYAHTPHQTFAQATGGNSRQHPSPGSYTRVPFNPQSRSFAPSGKSPHRPTENGTNPQPTSNHFGNTPLWQDNSNNSRRSAPNSQPNKGRSNSTTPGASNSKSSENQDSIAKWGTPSHLPPKPPPSEVPYNFDIMGRASNSSPKIFPVNNASVQPKQGPLVVSGATGRQKTQVHGGMATGM